MIFNFKNLSKRDKSKKDVSFLDMSFLNISSFLDMSFLTRLQTRLSSYKKQMILQNLPTVQHKRIMLPHCSRVSYCDACVKNGSRSFCSFFLVWQLLDLNWIKNPFSGPLCPLVQCIHGNLWRKLPVKK